MSEKRWMTTAYVPSKEGKPRVAAKSVIVWDREKAFEYANAWLEQGYVVRVEQ